MAERGEYKGKAMLILNPESKFPFQFGRAKAKLIVENIEEIMKFADEGD